MLLVFECTHMGIHQIPAACMCRYQKPGGMSWLECYMKITNTQPDDLKEAFLYVSAVTMRDTFSDPFLHLSRPF